MTTPGISIFKTFICEYFSKFNTNFFREIFRKKENEFYTMLLECKQILA